MYTVEYVEENYDRLITTETARKLLLSERYKPLDELCLGFIKNVNEVVFFDLDLYLDNKSFYDENYPKIRIHHQTLNKLSKLKELGIKYTKTKIVNPVKKIDKDYLQFNGKSLRVERWVKNHYDKMNFRVETEPDNWDGVFELLKFWDKEKRKDTLMTFTGHDVSFFKRFYKESKEKTDILSLYFYDNDKLIAFQVMEQVEPNFWVLHTRKTDRFNYSNLNLYVDIYTFRHIMQKYDNEFLVEMGYEMGKPTEYKIKRFPDFGLFYAYNLTILKDENIIKILF